MRCPSGQRSGYVCDDGSFLRRVYVRSNEAVQKGLSNPYPGIFGGT
jgi:hypothetical protein